MKLFVTTFFLALSFLFPAIGQQKFAERLQNPSTVLAKIVNVNIPEKDEYETQEEYEQRIPKLDTAKEYAFELPIKTRYVIEDTSLDCSIGKLVLDYDGNYAIPGRFNWPIAEDLKTLSGYNGVNAFGRNVRVKSQLFRTYILINIPIDTIHMVCIRNGDSATLGPLDVEPMDEFGQEYSSMYALKVHRQIECRLAKDFSQNLCAVAFVSFRGYDKITKETNHIEPTISSPTDLYTETFEIEAVIHKILLYRKDTKVIDTICQIK